MKKTAVMTFIHSTNMKLEKKQATLHRKRKNHNYNIYTQHKKKKERCSARIYLKEGDICDKNANANANLNEIFVLLMFYIILHLCTIKFLFD